MAYNGLFRILVKSKIRGNLLFFSKALFRWNETMERNAAAIFHHEGMIRKNLKNRKNTIDNCCKLIILKAYDK